MRVLQVTPVGFKRHIVGLYETQLHLALASAGIESVAISVSGDSTLAGVKTLNVKPGLASELSIKAIERAVKAEEYDLIHAHSSTWSFVPLYALLSDRLQRGSPQVLNSHGFLGSTRPANRPRRWPISLHSGQPRPLLALRQTAHYLADKTICLTQLEKSHVMRVTNLPERRFAVIPNAVSVSRFETHYDFANKHGLPFAEYILYVGHLKPIKGVPNLLQAYEGASRRFPRLGLVILTYDSLRVPSLCEEIRRCGLSSAAQVFDYSKERFADIDLVSAYFGAEALVLPSLAESSPTVVLEAYCARKPVIATAVGGVPETVIPGKTGILVPANDPRTLQEAIGYLHENESERLAMGSLGHSLVLERHTWPAVARQIIALYQRVVREHE